MGDNKRTSGGQWGSALCAEVVAFLRRWLPDEARQVYREMIREDPATWYQHPHFSGGIIVKHALRGNGITERVLGVPDLNAIWPDLLRAAVEEEDAPEFPAASEPGSEDVPHCRPLVAGPPHFATPTPHPVNPDIIP